ncbi:MAG: hypothetical protein IJI96_02585 [Methanobrevibacter sp.]|nr:hypothetical protein [Methanobrevibacter sp.]MBQ6627393.1 hypothetical protein [Methanobrevibacter sp.]
MVRSLESLKGSYRAIGRKLESMRMDAAIQVGILPLSEGKPFWLAEEIDWDDPRLSDMKEKFFFFLDKHYELGNQVGRLEAIQANDLPRWEAEQVAYGWLNILGDKSNAWLIEHKLNTFSLTEAILNNPNFLQEVVSDE